eukprot:TRINITY_DN23494_c0_g1_i6.p1 TRINITY_DN23494_c0_g1~~TRINITY_DN23494_c0_g1_i6.p1  ORF type:complete len:117 (-),score=13.44 TRINITY_DN23494_c0_g1_i6:63-413(-)
MSSRVETIRQTMAGGRTLRQLSINGLSSRQQCFTASSAPLSLYKVAGTIREASSLPEMPQASNDCQIQCQARGASCTCSHFGSMELVFHHILAIFASTSTAKPVQKSFCQMLLQLC